MGVLLFPFLSFAVLFQDFFHSFENVDVILRFSIVNFIIKCFWNYGVCSLARANIFFCTTIFFSFFSSKIAWYFLHSIVKLIFNFDFNFLGR